MTQQERDQYWMQQALKQAQQGAAVEEVPIGAILIRNNQILSASYNQPIAAVDPTAHAEILCIREAAKQVQNYRLIDTTLYVTLEPCSMCAGAIIQARIPRVVFAASEPRSGAAGSVFNVLQNPVLNHRVEVESGVMAEESAEILRNFFKQRRGK